MPVGQGPVGGLSVLSDEFCVPLGVGDLAIGEAGVGGYFGCETQDVEANLLATATTQADNVVARVTGFCYPLGVGDVPVGAGEVGGYFSCETWDSFADSLGIATATAETAREFTPTAIAQAFAFTATSSGQGYVTYAIADATASTQALRDLAPPYTDEAAYGCVQPKTVTSTERRMWAPYSGFPGLEALRKATLAAASLDTRIPVQARSVVSLAFEGDIRAYSEQVYAPPLGLRSIIHCDRRRLFDIDQDLQKTARLYAPAVAELATLGIEQMYLTMFLARLESSDYLSRASTASAVVLLTAVLLNDA